MKYTERDKKTAWNSTQKIILTKVNPIAKKMIRSKRNWWISLKQNWHWIVFFCMWHWAWVWKNYKKNALILKWNVLKTVDAGLKERNLIRTVKTRCELIMWCERSNDCKAECLSLFSFHSLLMAIAWANFYVRQKRKQQHNSYMYKRTWETTTNK